MPNLEDILLEKLTNRQKPKMEFQLQNAPQAFLKGLYTLGSGQQYQEPKSTNETDILDQLIKMNTLQTGTPEFKREQAQTQANMDINKYMQQKEIERQLADLETENLKKNYDASYQNQFPQQPASIPRIGESASIYSQPNQTEQPIARQGITGIPQEQQVNANNNTGIPQYINEPQGSVWDAKQQRFIQQPPKVVENPQYKSAINVQEKRQLGDLEAEQKKRGADVMRQSSAHMIGGGMKRLSDAWVGAFKEGGVGNIGRDLFYTQVAERVGGGLQDKYPITASLPGLKTEIVAKMMPLLTQQGDEKGSVRLVESIFRKLEQTLPSGQTGPKSAKSMMEATIRNQYGVVKAFQDNPPPMRLSEMNEQQLDTYSNFLMESAQQIPLKPEEEQAMQQIIQTSLGAFDEILDGDGGQVVDEGELNGRRVVKYADGRVEYAD